MVTKPKHLYMGYNLQLHNVFENKLILKKQNKFGGN